MSAPEMRAMPAALVPNELTDRELDTVSGGETKTPPPPPPPPRVPTHDLSIMKVVD